MVFNVWGLRSCAAPLSCHRCECCSDTCGHTTASTCCWGSRHTRGSQGQHRPDPEQLQVNNNPTELRNWISKFWAVFITSNLNNVNLTDQQAYFFAYLDAPLTATMRSVVRNTNPIFGDDSCMWLFQDEFRLKYPLFSHCLNFSWLMQAEGQTIFAYIVDLWAKALEADLADLTNDDIVMFMFVRGCTDVKLRKKLCKLDTQDLATTGRQVRAYE